MREVAFEFYDMSTNKTHIYGFRSLLLCCFIDDADYTFVIKLERCGSLNVVKLFKCLVSWKKITGVDEGYASLCFLGRRNDGVDNFTHNKYSVISWKGSGVY